MAMRADYYAFRRFERLYARREHGYDPENGVFVDVRHNGNSENVEFPPATYWAMDARAADAARRATYRWNDPLPEHVGTVVAAMEARRNVEHFFYIITGCPVSAQQAYQEARAKP